MPNHDFVPRSKEICMNGGCYNATTQCCSNCGMNPEEAERRKMVPVVKCRDGLRRKIISQSGTRRRAIVRIAADGTEVRFPSIREAARATGGDAKNIQSACDCGRVSYGFRWRYAEVENG